MSVERLSLFGFFTIDFSTALDPASEWQEYFTPVFREQEREMAEFYQQYLDICAAVIADDTLPDVAIVDSPRPSHASPAPKRLPHTVARA